MKYITRGNTSPQSKRKLYFTGHPDDCKTYLEKISSDILKLHDCAIFYDENPEQPEDMDNFISDLDAMKLIVVIISGKYVYGETFAHNVVFRHAAAHHTAILPILTEPGSKEFMEVLNKKCGDLQFLNLRSTDATEISYEEKLKHFLEPLLIGEDYAQEVRKSFDAYIFLSYRKKDRKYAQELMRLIHQNDFCRDIAIWYDEFLVPGENFNNAIKDAMEKSKLFALAVTPNLLEDPNYVMTTEYPSAKAANMKVLPVNLVPTDQNMLKSHYKGIPELIEKTDAASLAQHLKQFLAEYLKPAKSNDPQHLFRIGMAYLNGIDVEMDKARGAQLITAAAEAGLPEAISKLRYMYEIGDGVERNYDTAIAWQRAMVEHYKRDKTDKTAPLQVLYHTQFLASDMLRFRRLGEAARTCKDLLSMCQKAIEQNWQDIALPILSDTLQKLSYINEITGHYDAAEYYLHNAAEVQKLLNQVYKGNETLSQKAASIETLAKEGEYLRKNGDYTNAQKKLCEAYEMSQSLLAHPEDLGSYHRRIDQIDYQIFCNLCLMMPAKERISGLELCLQRADTNFAAYPDSSTGNADAAKFCLELANTYLACNAPEKAEEACLDAIRRQQKIIDSKALEDDYVDLVQMYLKLCEIQLEMNANVNMMAALAQANTVNKQLENSRQHRVLFYQNLAKLHQYHAQFHLKFDNYQDAFKFIDLAIAQQHQVYEQTKADSDRYQMTIYVIVKAQISRWFIEYYETKADPDQMPRALYECGKDVITLITTAMDMIRALAKENPSYQDEAERFAKEQDKLIQALNDQAEKILIRFHQSARKNLSWLEYVHDLYIDLFQAYRLPAFAHRIDEIMALYRSFQ